MHYQMDDVEIRYYLIHFDVIISEQGRRVSVSIFGFSTRVIFVHRAAQSFGDGIFASIYMCSKYRCLRLKFTLFIKRIPLRQKMEGCRVDRSRFDSVHRIHFLLRFFYFFVCTLNTEFCRPFFVRKSHIEAYTHVALYTCNCNHDIEK